MHFPGANVHSEQVLSLTLFQRGKVSLGGHVSARWRQPGAGPCICRVSCLGQQHCAPASRAGSGQTEAATW